MTSERNSEWVWEPGMTGHYGRRADETAWILHVTKTPRKTWVAENAPGEWRTMAVAKAKAERAAR